MLKDTGTGGLRTKDLLVSTRCHFQQAGTGTGLINDRVDFEYDLTKPVDDLMSSCPAELVVYIHGFNGGAGPELFPDALQQLGYDVTAKPRDADYATTLHKMVTFAWDGKRHLDLLGFSRARKVARNNGQKLAQFFSDFHNACGTTTRIRVVAHSLGSEVMLHTLKSLDEDFGFSSPIIRSVHFLGSAADNEAQGVTGNLGSYIESQTDKLYNFHSEDDNQLGAPFFPASGFAWRWEEKELNLTCIPTQILVGPASCRRITGTRTYTIN